eukprot:g4940.t1
MRMVMSDGRSCSTTTPTPTPTTTMISHLSHRRMMQNGVSKTKGKKKKKKKKKKNIGETTIDVASLVINAAGKAAASSSLVKNKGAIKKSAAVASLVVNAAGKAAAASSLVKNKGAIKKSTELEKSDVGSDRETNTFADVHEAEDALRRRYELQMQKEREEHETKMSDLRSKLVEAEHRINILERVALSGPTGIKRKLIEAKLRAAKRIAKKRHAVDELLGNENAYIRKLETMIASFLDVLEFAAKREDEATKITHKSEGKTATAHATLAGSSLTSASRRRSSVRCISLFAKHARSTPSTEELRNIFGNVREVCAQGVRLFEKLHKLLRDGQRKGSASDLITAPDVPLTDEIIVALADIVRQHHESEHQTLRVHREYYGNYMRAHQKALDEARQKYAKFRSIEKLTMTMNLSSIVVIPVQRLPRRVLLLKEIRKYLASHESEPARALTKAIEAIEATLRGCENHLNTTKLKLLQETEEQASKDFDRGGNGDDEMETASYSSSAAELDDDDSLFLDSPVDKSESSFASTSCHRERPASGSSNASSSRSMGSSRKMKDDDDCVRVGTVANLAMEDKDQDLVAPTPPPPDVALELPGNDENHRHHHRHHHHHHHRHQQHDNDQHSRIRTTSKGGLTKKRSMFGSFFAMSSGGGEGEASGLKRASTTIFRKGRQFVEEGYLDRLGSSALSRYHTRWVLLFSDSLMYAKEQHSKILVTYGFRGAAVEAHGEDGFVLSCPSIQITSMKEKAKQRTSARLVHVRWRAESTSIRDRWLSLIRKQIANANRP